MRWWDEEKPYHYVRYIWWNYLDLDKLSKKLKERFTVVHHHMPTDESQPVRYSRDELSVKADTLSARLGVFRALLFQREKIPFTKRDLELRKIILALYPHSRPTIFPWFFSSEPNFEKKIGVLKNEKRNDT